MDSADFSMQLRRLTPAQLSWVGNLVEDTLAGGDLLEQILVDGIPEHLLRTVSR